MAEVKHTPGPWECRPDDLAEGLYWVVPEPDTVEEDEANARLIAAAPDLFEALQTLATECSQVWSAEEFPALKSAFAALSKSTTQQEGR